MTMPRRDDVLRLAASVAATTEQVESLRQDIALAEQARVTSTRRYVATMTANFVLIVLVLALTVVGRFSSRDTHDVLQQIRSCTQPGGACYEKGQANQQQAINEIIQAIRGH